MLLALHPCHLGWHWCLLQTFPIDSNDFLLISQRVFWPPLPPTKQGKAISAGELTFQEYSQHSTERIYWISSTLLCVCVCVCVLSHFSCVCLFAIIWTVAHQAPLPMVFSRQEYWSGLQCPPPGDLSHPGIEPTCFMSFVLAGRFFTTSTTREAQHVPCHL